jgi:hypothetical protein
MNLQRSRLIGILLMCFGGFGLLGGLLAWALHGHPVLAAVTLGLVVVGGGLAWWRWGSTDELRRRLRRKWMGVEGLQWRVLLVLIAVAVTLAFVGTAVGDQTWDALLTNLATELAGAAVTYVILQWMIGQRSIKEELIAQMGSDVRDVAVPAADELRRRGWLTDGSLRWSQLGDANLEGADLWLANLEGASLRFANLQGARLSRANLEGADLWRAQLQRGNMESANLAWTDMRHSNLQGVDLWLANLEGASLDRADLKEARLGRVHLQEADMEDADLEGANLWGAQLQGAELERANLNKVFLQEADVATRQLAQAKSLAGATLPDGTKLSEDNWQAEFEEWRKKQEEQESDD